MPQRGTITYYPLTTEAAARLGIERKTLWRALNCRKGHPKHVAAYLDFIADKVSPDTLAAVKAAHRAAVVESALAKLARLGAQLGNARDDAKAAAIRDQARAIFTPATVRAFDDLQAARPLPELATRSIEILAPFAAELAAARSASCSESADSATGGQAR